MSWREWALCAGVDQSVFFTVGGGTGALDEARSLCGSCPVQRECLAEALAVEAKASGDPHGFIGGMGATERRPIVMRMRRERRERRKAAKVQRSSQA